MQKNGGIGRSQSVRHLLQATGTGGERAGGGAGPSWSGVALPVAPAYLAACC